jgi:hypothetical protein
MIWPGEQWEGLSTKRGKCYSIRYTVYFYCSSACMSLFTILPALVFAAFAIALIAFIGWSLFHSVFADGLRWMGRQKLTRKEGLLKTADSLIKADSFSEALALLRNAFLLDEMPSSPALIESAAHHHMSILSRLIAISERTSSHIPNLAVVEDLLSTRAQLLRSLHEAETAKKSLKQRRKDKKELPQWAVAEYENRSKDILDKLSTNKKSLTSKLDELFNALSSAPSRQEVTYH